jgi:hypothetical protein
MFTTSYIPSLRPEPERDRWKRYRLPEPGTGQMRSWTRVTTLAGTLADEHNLTQWKRRMVLQGLATRPHLLDSVLDIVRELEHHDPEARKQAKRVLDAICDDASDAAGAGDGARLGTRLHLITEWADAGRLDEILKLVEPELLDDLGAYLAALVRNGVDRPAEWIERIVVNSTVDAAGTLDRIVRVGGGLPMIGDLKTAKSLDFSAMEIAIQLATYANAEWMWDDATGQLVPMPEVDKETALVFHLPVGQADCTIYAVDLVAGWEAAQLAHKVRLTRKGGKAMKRPWHPPASTVLRLIRTADHEEVLVGIWRDHVQKGRPWTSELNEAAAARKAQLIDANPASPATAAA